MERMQMSKFKRWTVLGLGAAMVAGCSAEESPRPAETGDMAAVASAGEGEGESGEGGVDVARAARDPLVYLSALALVEAHIRAAEDAVRIGEREAAAEMFAHPVSEVLIDMAPTFEQLGVPTFDSQLIEASQAVFAGEDPAAIAARADRILKTLEAAAAKAPAGGVGNPDVPAGVIADLIDRAALQYATAAESPAYGPYLDGYGFRITAEAWRNRYAATIVQASPEVAEAIDTALAQTRRAYPTPARPPVLSADQAALLSTASTLRLAL